MALDAGWPPAGDRGDPGRMARHASLAGCTAADWGFVAVHAGPDPGRTVCPGEIARDEFDQAKKALNPDR